jgi:hypothetical protein
MESMDRSTQESKNEEDESQRTPRDTEKKKKLDHSRCSEYHCIGCGSSFSFFDSSVDRSLDPVLDPG